MAMTMDADSRLQIGDVARLVGMSQRTIRYYEEIGLMNSVRRLEGGKRVYTDDDVRRLKLIKRLKVLGLTLADMHELEAIWSIHRSNDRVLGRLQEILTGHLDRLDGRIADLQLLRNEIVEYEERIKSKLARS